MSTMGKKSAINHFLYYKFVTELMMSSGICIKKPFALFCQRRLQSTAITHHHHNHHQCAKEKKNNRIFGKLLNWFVKQKAMNVHGFFIPVFFLLVLNKQLNKLFFKSDTLSVLFIIAKAMYFSKLTKTYDV